MIFDVPMTHPPSLLVKRLRLAGGVIGWVLAGLFLALWKSGTNQDWAMGTVPDWLTVIIGFIGLFALWIAVEQLRAQQEDAHQRWNRDRRAQASSIYWVLKPLMAERAAGTRVAGQDYYVVNRSSEPIRNVGFVAVSVEEEPKVLRHILDRPAAPDEEHYAARLYYTDLPAGFRGVRRIQPFHSAETTSDTIWDVALVFADSADRYWIRMPNLVVEELNRRTTQDVVIDRVKEWRRQNPVTALEAREPQDPPAQAAAEPNPRPLVVESEEVVVGPPDTRPRSRMSAVVETCIAALTQILALIARAIEALRRQR